MAALLVHLMDRRAAAEAMPQIERRTITDGIESEPATNSDNEANDIAVYASDSPGVGGFGGPAEGAPPMSAKPTT